jgi:hypothetical protein
MCQLPFSEDKTVINILFKCLSELSDATKSLINIKHKKHTPFRIIQYRMETYRYVHKQDNSNYLNDSMLQQVGCVWQHDPRRGNE